MKFFRPNPEYIKYAYSIDKYIINTENLMGIVIRLKEMIYFLPIVSSSDSDYDENHNLRKTTPAILRMFDAKNQDYLGKCLFSNMFPIPYNDLIQLDINNFEEKQKVILEKKLEYLQSNQKRIIKAAERLYEQKVKKYNQPYLAVTIDFHKLENVANQWELDHYKKHYNRFPDSQFFLTNPNTKGVSEYYLMNKNVKVAKLQFDNENQRVVSILKLYNCKYAPLECFENGVITKSAISQWFRGRGIPSWRDGLADFLDNIGIENKDILLNKAFGLSLSDQYWMNPINMLMDWRDINFFDNNFNSYDYQKAIFENKVLDIKKVDLYSPNNTSDGMLKKAWIVGEDNKRYLLKDSYKQSGMEPFNEVLANMICEVLELDHVKYSLEVMNGKILSKCECFIDKDTELLSAYAILKYNDVDMKNKNMFKKYIDILKENGLENVENAITKMFILDYLIANTDRHLGNFGVIRNVETLKWDKLAPNFDSGQAMMSQKKEYEMNFYDVKGCFFNDKELDFEQIIQKVMENIDFEINFTELLSVVDSWKKLLYSYRHVSDISEERIEIITKGLEIRIKKLKAKF